MLNRFCSFLGEAYRGTEQPALPLLLHQRAVGPAHAPSGIQEQSVAHAGNANTHMSTVTQ